MSLEPGRHSFDRPEQFDALAYVLRSLVTMPGTHQVEVLLKTSWEKAQQFISPAMGTLETAPEGVLYRRSAAQLEWVVYLLISLDFPVVVIRPPELREMLRQMGGRALQMANIDG